VHVNECPSSSGINITHAGRKLSESKRKKAEAIIYKVSNKADRNDQVRSDSNQSEFSKVDIGVEDH